MILKVKNWDNYQHYKDRNPPWIKIHKKQLDDPDFMSLSFACVGLAQFLWILASESKDGIVDASVKHLTFRLRKPEREIKKLLSILIDSGFFILVEGCTQTLADDTESCSEGETEGETEGEDSLVQFDLFWSTFADKRGRDGALKSWKRIKPNKELCDTIIAGAESYAKQRVQILAKNGNPKMAQGWLTDKRWEDEDTGTTQPINHAAKHGW